MIRNPAEFEEASRRLGDTLKRFDEHRARLKEAGLADAEVWTRKKCCAKRLR